MSEPTDQSPRTGLPGNALVVVALASFCLIGALAGFAFGSTSGQSLRSSFLQIVTTVVGPFFGAGLAFTATKVHDYSKVKRQDIAAVRRAIATMAEQLDDLLQFRRGLFESINEQARSLPTGAPKWMHAKPLEYVFVSDAKIDRASLAFVFEDAENVLLYSQLFHAGRIHAHLIHAAESLKSTTLAMQDRISLALGEEEDATLGRLREVVGRSLATKISDLITATLDCCAEDDVRTYIDAAAALKRATLRRYPRARALQTLRVPAYLALNSLPALPPAFAQADLGRY